MARARNIKPGFFTNEDLVELPFSTRLLFIGLWTLADREGRLDDRPKRIKMDIFPADNINVDEALDQLQSKDFILRYQHDGKSYIQIINFSKHQNPHKHEKESTIPPPDINHTSTIQAQCKQGHENASTVQAPYKHSANMMQEGVTHHRIPVHDGKKSGSSTEKERENHQILPESGNKQGFCTVFEPDKHHASTVQVPYKHSSCHADSLIPDSLIRTNNTLSREIAVLAPASDDGESDGKRSEKQQQRHVQIAVLLRNAGVRPFAAQHPYAIEWGENPQITDAVLLSALDMARQYKGPDASISPEYLKPIIAGILNPQRSASAAIPEKRWYDTATGIQGKGKELGLPLRDGELPMQLLTRIYHQMRQKGPDNPEVSQLEKIMDQRKIAYA